MILNSILLTLCSSWILRHPPSPCSKCSASCDVRAVGRLGALDKERPTSYQCHSVFQIHSIFALPAVLTSKAELEKKIANEPLENSCVSGESEVLSALQLELPALKLPKETRFPQRSQSQVTLQPLRFGASFLYQDFTCKSARAGRCKGCVFLEALTRAALNFLGR